jgi:hypothetical protein
MIEDIYYSVCEMRAVSPREIDLIILGIDHIDLEIGVSHYWKAANVIIVII